MVDPISLTVGGIVAALVARAADKTTDKIGDQVVTGGASVLRRLKDKLRARFRDRNDDEATRVLEALDVAPDDIELLRSLADVIDRQVNVDPAFRTELTELQQEAAAAGLDLDGMVRVALGFQVVRGNQHVHIDHVVGSQIQIVYAGSRRFVPLEPAAIPLPPTMASPAWLLRARAEVVPFTVHGELRGELAQWCHEGPPFAARIVAGPGGCGKTRLGVELCDSLGRLGWLCGLLAPSADEAALEALVETPTARLVVIDYAETRRDHLARLLPLLAHRSVEDHPVRVLLLVRAKAGGSDDWKAALYHHSDALDVLVHQMPLDVLTAAPFGHVEREALFRIACTTLAARLARPERAVPLPSRLASGASVTALDVLVAAYLAVQDVAGAVSDRVSALTELLAHEDRYWQLGGGPLVGEESLRRRCVALATLTAAGSESEAVELLRLVPGLSDSTERDRFAIAEWLHSLYPGPGWWNPLEPDTVGELLVVQALGPHSQVLDGVLDGGSTGVSVRALTLYERAAADHPQFAATLRPLLSARLGDLCAAARSHAMEERDIDLLLGRPTLASALTRLVDVVRVDPAALSSALALFDQDNATNLLLGPLMTALTAQLVAFRRDQARANPAKAGELADALVDQALFLRALGRREESFASSRESVDLLRPLAQSNPGAHEATFARALNYWAISLAEAGNYGDALAQIDEAIAIRRELLSGGAAVELDLARSLNNRSRHLEALDREAEALEAIDEAITLWRQIAASDPAQLHRVGEALDLRADYLLKLGRAAEAVVASGEALDLARSLYDSSPATYLQHLAASLLCASWCLGAVDERHAAVEVAAEAVRSYRRLCEVRHERFPRQLAASLRSLATQLEALGRLDEATAARDEAQDIHEDLVLLPRWTLLMR